MSAATHTVPLARPSLLERARLRLDLLPTLAAVVIFVGMVIYGEVAYGRIVQMNTISNLLINNAHLIILAVGLTFVILTGGIDLSVGAVIAFTSVAGVMLIAVLGFGSGLLNIIPLAALIGVMITVSIATFDWDSLRSLKDQSPLEILTTLLTVVIVVATNNLAYGVAAGLALYYAGGFAAKAFVRAS